MKVARRGYRISYLEYPWVVFKQWLGVPLLPSDESTLLSVIRVSKSGVEPHELKIGKDQIAPIFLTPVDETIYANCQGTLCKWATDHFETATAAERSKLDGINKLITDLNAKSFEWSKREIGTDSSRPEMSIEVGNDFSLLVRQGNVKKSEYDSPTIDLYRNGKFVKKLWHVNAEPRRVSSAEYTQVFRFFDAK
jgi:hypothetical protein